MISLFVITDLPLSPRKSPFAQSHVLARQHADAPFPIKKTRSHGTIAKRVGLAKRLKPAKGLPFSSSRVGRQRPVRNSLDHLVGAGASVAKDVSAFDSTDRTRITRLDRVRLLLRRASWSS